jgi:hypothetical protein
LSKHPARSLKRLYERREALIATLNSEHDQARPRGEIEA